MLYYIERGVDIGIDAAGNTDTRQGVLSAVRKGGEILLLGLHEVMCAVDFTAIVRKEQRLQGSYCYTPKDFRTTRKLIESGDVSILPWKRV